MNKKTLTAMAYMLGRTKPSCGHYCFQYDNNNEGCCNCYQKKSSSLGADLYIIPCALCKEQKNNV